jgi:hypothetical protein
LKKKKRLEKLKKLFLIKKKKLEIGGRLLGKKWRLSKKVLIMNLLLNVFVMV